MNLADRDIEQLQCDVENDPRDPYLRCNLACLLASYGDYQGAFAHLGVAMDVANGPVAAGCVVAAIRQITNEFSRLWQLPDGGTHLTLVSA